MSPAPFVMLGLLPVALAAQFVAAAARGGNLARNHSVGIKTRATLVSDRAWEAGHRAAVPWLRTMAAVIYAASAAVLALTLAAAGAPDDAVVLGIFLGAIAIIAVLAVRITRVANRAARDAAAQWPPR